MNPSAISSSLPALIRAAALFGPLALTWVLWIWRWPGPRLRAAVYLATLWNIAGLLVVHVLAERLTWWSYDAVGGLVLGLPADLWLGWALLWGAVPVLGLAHWPLAAVVVTLAAADFVLMPAAAPIVVLDDGWWVGEVVAIGLCLVPGLILARWTADGRRLCARGFLQAIGFVVIAFWALPTVVMNATGGSWGAVWDRPPWAWALALGLALVPGIMGLRAVQLFAEVGGGTPVPFDPTRRLVTAGPYAYVANPMQASACALWLILGAFIGSLSVMAAGLVGALYSFAVSLREEDHALVARFGMPWKRYRTAMRAWRVRWRPWRAEGEPPARLWFDPGDGRAARFARWIERRGPAGLEVRAMDGGGAAAPGSGSTSSPGDDPSQPDIENRRGTLMYDPGDATPSVVGIAAAARALDHVHLGWAWAGWGVGWLAGLRQLGATPS